VNYYSHHIGDYRRDTAHLSLLEHGVYRQMLDTYYLSEEPLPLDEARLMRSLCVRNADEMQAVKNLLADFFLPSDAGYLHKRCTKEIAAFHAKSAAAKASAEARWHREESKPNAKAMRTHSEGNANHKPITNKELTSAFASFWDAYPKKKNKGIAEKAFAKVKPDAELLQTILMAVEGARQSADWLKSDGQFIPHPATWLNARGWEDGDGVASAKPWEVS
jgi:uncharacterized protein YdaU (DUF1376 family)